MIVVLEYLVIAAVIGLVVFFLAVLVFGRGEQLAPLPARTSPSELPDGAVTGNDLRAVRFAVGLRGYRMGDVDWTLDRTAEELDRLRAEVRRLGGDPNVLGPTGDSDDGRLVATGVGAQHHTPTGEPGTGETPAQPWPAPPAQHQDQHQRRDEPAGRRDMIGRGEAGHPEAGHPEAGHPEAGHPEAGRPEQYGIPAAQEHPGAATSAPPDVDQQR